MRGEVFLSLLIPHKRDAVAVCLLFFNFFLLFRMPNCEVNEEYGNQSKSTLILAFFEHCICCYIRTKWTKIIVKLPLSWKTWRICVQTHGHTHMWWQNFAKTCGFTTCEKGFSWHVISFSFLNFMLLYCSSILRLYSQKTNHKSY